MAFPTFQAAGTPAEATAGSISPAWPAHQAGDIGILIVASENHVSIGPDQGFRLVDRGRRKAHGSSGTWQCLNVFWCRATSGAMSAPTIYHTGDHVRAVILTFRGCASEGLPYSDVAALENVGNNQSALFPSVTTVGTDNLVLGICVHGQDVSGSAGCSGYANANLASITEVFDSQSTIGGGSCTAAYTGQKATAGATGDTTATTSAPGNHVEMHIALKPQADVAPDKTPWFAGWGVPAGRDTAGTISPAWPQGHQAGDIGILIVESGAWPIAAPGSGWTEFPESPQNSGTSGSSNGNQLSVYWKRAASGAEAAPTLTFVGDHIQAQIITYRGCPPSGNPYEVSEGTSTASTNTYTAPGGTTTKNNQRIVQIIGHGLDLETAKNASGETNADLKWLAEVEWASLWGSGSGWVIIESRKPVAGTFGNTTGSLIGFSSQGNLTLSLMPEGGADIQLDFADYDLTMQGIDFVADRVLDVAHASFAETTQDISFEITFDYEIFLMPAQVAVVPQEISLEQRFGTWTREAAQDSEWTKEDPQVEE